LTADFTRRRLLQFGVGGYLGLNLVGLWRAEAAGPKASERWSIRSCVFVFLYGGPSHIDTFDPKPDAPAEVRGEFATTQTSAPGVRVCEHLPHLAKWMHKAAIVRSMHHEARLHDSGSIHLLTGRPLDGPDRELFAPLPQHFPSYGSAVAAIGPHRGCEVPFASLPFAFHNVVPTPCQGAGFLGSVYDPLRVEVDPAGRRYRVEELEQRPEVDRRRRDGRRGLLDALQPARSDAVMTPVYDKAFRLLGSDTVRTALDVTREPPRVRERYGFTAEGLPTGEVNGGGGETGFARNMRGQNFLLARRLVEAGVPFVNVYDYRQQGQNWDAHVRCAHQHKKFLLPPFDRGLSALIEDLDDRGLLDSTLVVVAGEFGRTPRLNTTAGRDHWPDCSSVLLIGGGVQGGAVYGASDRLGAFPAADPVTPGDLAATIYSRFGLSPATEIRDQTGRPYPLATGEPLTKLFAG
jgi:hypothetical protein